MIEPRKDGASATGYHFLTAWTNCPRRFLFEKVWGYAPKGDIPALVLGKAFHRFKELYYTVEGCDGSWLTAAEEIIKPAELTEEARKEVLDRMVASCNGWHLAYGQYDTDRFNVLGVEEEFRLQLGSSPYFLTGRLDARLEDKADGLEYVMETKSTKMPAAKMTEDTSEGGQIDAYSWAWHALHPEGHFGGVLVDVTHSSLLKAGPKVECTRSQPVLREKKHLRDFEVGAIITFSRIAEAVDAYFRDPNWASLFTCNYSACSGMVACPFRGICRNLKAGDTSLTNFKIEEPAVERGTLPLYPELQEAIHGI